MTPEQERVSSILQDAVIMLCKNSLSFELDLTVQGLIGVTLDKNNVFLIHINERIQPDGVVDSVKCEPNDSDHGEPASEVHYPKKDKPKRRPTGQPRGNVNSFKEFDVNHKVKSEFGYPNQDACYGNYDYAENVVDQTIFEDVKPMSIMKHIQMTYGSGTRSTAVASTIVTESYNVMDDGILESQRDDVQDDDQTDEMSSWVTGENLFPIPSDQPAQHAVPSHMMWKGGRPSFRGGGARKPKVSSRGQGGLDARGHLPKSAPGSGRLKASPGNPYVINETSHLCGYPNCGKRFRFRHDLLRHQTKKHGRTPVQRGSAPRSYHGFEEFG